VTNLIQPGKNVRSLLRRGLLAGHAGDRAEARRWFQAALGMESDNIIALLWLAWLVPTQQESLELLSRVLELDPRNEQARAGIRWARRRPSIGDSLLDADQPSSTPDVPGRSDLLRETLAQEKARSGIAAQRARRLIGPLGLLLTIAACLFVVGVALVARYSPVMVLAWMLPTPTPTATSTPALAPTPVPSPTAIATPTSTSTHTPSPSPAATATNAATPTIVPSPTATPTIPPPAPPTVTPVPLVPTATPTPVPVSPPAVGDDKWIDVDLTHQQVTAYEGSIPVFQSIVSTGLPNTPTVVGQFRIYWKLSATVMAGPGYYLPGVPYTMYFYSSYALHGTYWHNNFGQPMSHGCVNLRTEDAQWLFNWADPPLPVGASQVRSSDTNPGTLVVVHY
jgi:lipoprotein-anchoring transpeptidase ErfK/SrfK